MQVDAAGKSYKQTDSLVYLGGSVAETSDARPRITRKKRAAWTSTKQYKEELYDLPNLPLSLTMRVVKADVVEALLH